MGKYQAAEAERGAAVAARDAAVRAREAALRAQQDADGRLADLQRAHQVRLSYGDFILDMLRYLCTLIC